MLTFLTFAARRSYPLGMTGTDLGAFLVIASLVAVPILAHKKGRRWWAWLIPSLFLGPIMLVPVLLIKKRVARKEEVLSPGEMKSHYFPEPSLPNFGLNVETDPDAGYVYVISNPSLPEDLIKIGFTTRDPSERLKELDQAGLPTEYIEHYRIFTKDARQLEVRLHKHFATNRFREDKEFFKVSPHEVYQVLNDWGVKSLEL
jgi:hypothetical protein